MNVFLVDGTYELFRHFFAVPSVRDVDGYEVGAVRGSLTSIVSMLENDVTHLGVATDHVVESFRNTLWPGYKTDEGIDPDVLGQFVLLEDALEAMGVTVWPMSEFEADDGLASAAAKASLDPRVEQVFVCTPDKDLAQCVVDRKVVQFDRRAGTLRDADGVEAKFGVRPASIPDYLALVGDAADGFPGLPGWGAKSTASVIGHYGHLEMIPEDPQKWGVTVRGSTKLAATLTAKREQAFLFRDLATLRTTASVFDSVDELYWTGPRAEFFKLCTRLDAGGLFRRVMAVVGKR